MKKIISSVGIIALVAIAVAGATGAFYNDTETSSGNIFVAGSIDLKVDHYFQSYNGKNCEEFCEVSEGAQNLVLNSGFEVPEVTNGAQWDIFPSGATGLEWTVEWVGNTTSFNSVSRPDPSLVEYHEGVLGSAYEGDQYAELDTDWDGPGGPLNGEPASVRVYQDIPTTPGKKYRVSFAFAPRPNTGNSQNQLEFKWDGTVVDTVSGSDNNAGIDWAVKTYDVTASGATTRISFADKGTEDSLGTFLDDVRVYELDCNYDLPGAASCELWDETNLGGQTFFDFNDIKPGDYGRNGISLHVFDNDAWACLIAHDGDDQENTVYESEGDDDEENGELQDYITFFAWVDLDQDALYDPPQETGLGTSTLGNLGSIVSLDSLIDTYLKATTTEYIALAWCAGMISVDEETGEISCDGSTMFDDAQSDSFSASLTAYAEQKRNNGDFLCEDVDLDGDDDPLSHGDPHI